MYCAQLGWLLRYLTMLYLIITLMDWVLMVDLHTDWFLYGGPLGTPWVQDQPVA